MKVAEYPEKSCREGIFTVNGTGANCELPLNHAGPCATLSDQLSIKRRDDWEAAHPDLATAVSDMDVILDPNKIEGAKQHTYPPTS